MKLLPPLDVNGHVAPGTARRPPEPRKQGSRAMRAGTPFACRRNDYRARFLAYAYTPVERTPLPGFWSASRVEWAA